MGKAYTENIQCKSTEMSSLQWNDENNSSYRGRRNKKKILIHLKLWKYEHGPPIKDSAVKITEISKSVLYPATE